MRDYYLRLGTNERCITCKDDRPLHQEPDKYGVWNTSGWAVLQGHIPCLVTSPVYHESYFRKLP